MSRLCRLTSVLVALLALAAFAATAAQAELPTYYTCVKASPKNTGLYTNKTCSAASRKR